MSADEKIAVVCEKFPLVSQTFVQLHAEILRADVFALGRTVDETARRLSIASSTLPRELEALAHLASAPSPGDRPSAAALAGKLKTALALTKP